MDTLKKVSIGVGLGLALSAYLQHERYEVEKEKEREDLATKEDVKALDAVANNDRYLKQIQVAKSCANSFRISQLVSRVEQCFPTSIATVSASGQQRTYTEFANRIRRAASGFVNELGVQPGDRIAILALNSESYLESFFSISMAGALPVPLNIRLSTQDLVDQLMDCECVALLVDEPMFVHVTQICNAVETLESIVTLGAVSPDHPVPPGSISLDILIESQEPLTEPVPFNGTEDIPENVYGIFYTGGTSGKAKGVMLTHEGLIFNAYTITNMVRFNDGIKYLHATPMFHLASGTAIFGVTMTGGTHVFIPKFAPDGVLRTIQEHKITHALLVPSMLQMLVSVPNLHDYDLRSVRYFTYGGSPMLEKTLLAALKAFPGAKFIQGYGMTEASPLMTLLGAEHHGVGSPVLTSVGQCVPHGELKILDPAGKEVPRGEVGEICYRGPNVMAGYYKTPEATMAVLRDNWLRTGDGGKMNENGFVFICDRIKDTINTGGENVYSQEVENCIAKLDGVLACAVIGIPDPVLVEKVAAIVVVKKDSKLTAEKVIEHCRARIARYKCPRAVFFRNDPLPLSGAGKVLKGILREPFWKNTDDASADVKPEPLVVVAKPTNNNTPSKISNNKNDNNHASDAK